MTYFLLLIGANAILFVLALTPAFIAFVKTPLDWELRAVLVWVSVFILGIVIWFGGSILINHLFGGA